MSFPVDELACKLFEFLQNNPFPILEKSKSSIEKAIHLVEQFNTGSISIEEAKNQVAQLIKATLKLDNLNVKRKILGTCLGFKEETLRLEIFKQLEPLFDFKHLSDDLKYKQAQELIDLEKQLCSAVESHIRDEHSKKTLPFPMYLYGDLLEYIWVLSLLEDNPNILNDLLISTRAENWIHLFPKKEWQDSELKSPLFFIFNSLQRIKNPSLETIKDIEMLKSDLNDPFITIYLGRVYQKMGDFDRALYCFHSQIDNENTKLGANYSLGMLFSDLGEYQKAIVHYEKALNIAEDGNDTDAEKALCQALAEIYYSLGEEYKKIRKGYQYLAIVKTGEKKEEMKLCYDFIADAFYSLKNYQKTLEYNQKGLTISQFLGDKKQEGKYFKNIGNLYKLLEEYEKAISNHKKALNIAKELKDKKAQIIAYNNLGGNYASQKDYQKALNYYEKSLTIALDSHDKKAEAKAYENCGFLSFELKQSKKAIGYFKKALDIDQNSSEETELIYTNLILSYKRLGEFKEALKYLEKNLDIAQKTNDEIFKIATYLSGGEIYASLGEHTKAIEYQKLCLEIAKDLHNEDAQADAYEALGSSYHALGYFSKAIEYFQQDLEIREKLEDKKGIRNAYKNLGDVYQSSGFNKKAENFYEKSLSITIKLEDQEDKASTYTDLGNIYRSLKKFHTAIGYYKKSINISKEFDKETNFSALAEIHYNLGEYANAIKYYEKSLDITIKSGAQDREVIIYDGLGAVYLSLGMDEKALEYFEKGLEIAQRLGNRASEAHYYFNLGNFYAEHKYDPQKAIEYYMKIFTISKELHNSLTECKAYIGCAKIYIFFDDFQKAIEYYMLSLTIAKDLKNLDGKRRINRNLGFVYRLQEKHHEAIKYLKKSLSITKKFKIPEDQGGIYTQLGLAYESLHQFKEAEKYFKKAIEIVSDLQQKLTDNKQWKISIFENQANAYMGLENILLRQKKTNLALEITDSRRSRTLNDILAKKMPGQNNEPLTCTQIQEFAKKQNSTFVIYSTSSSFEDEKEIGVWIIPPQGEIIWQLLTTTPIQKEMEDASSLLTSFPFNRARGDMEPFEVSPSHENPLLEDLQELFRISREDRKAAILERARKNTLKKFMEQLKIWHQAFISPVEKYLPKDPNQTVTIVPDGFLSQLPFAAFLGADGKYLIEKHPLSIAPSIKTLQLLSTHLKAFPNSCLVVGNPDTTNPKDELKLAEQEAEQVGAMLKCKDTNVLTKDKATVSAVQEGLQNARFIHLACHGQAGFKTNPHSVFEGRFILSPDQANPKGNFTAQEIAEMNLNAELIFLSACYSGTGKIQQEGSIGHVWAFLASKALSTIATYWPLPESELTVNMVKDFYKYMLEEKLNKAEALQKTMCKAIEKERDNPHHWGLFFLSGLKDNVDI